MPLKLVEPEAGRSKVYRVRGTYLGRYVDRTTETADKAKARRFLKAIAEQIERGELAGPEELTFAKAALSYGKAGGEERFMKPIIDHFGPKTLVRDLTQAKLDEAAHAIYPEAEPATRNRQFYTPVSAVLKHAGFVAPLKRPKGANGERRVKFMTEGEAKRLLAAAREVDAEFGVFLAWLLYTGLRLSEGLRVECRSVDLSASFAHVETTKNGKPRPVHLPPVLVAELANHPRGLDRKGKVFRFTKCGRIYELMSEAKEKAGADLDWVSFHYFRHTYGAWMRRHGRLDTSGLVATGAWASRESAALYEHVDTSEEARQSDLLPNVVTRA
ncbi:Phage integrase family protein [Rhizobiales bacterium GAS113]|nr:Phage integrase family protein [Rhizobiales bacterium GAS113]